MSRDDFMTIRANISLRDPESYNHDEASADPLWHSRKLLEHFQKIYRSLQFQLEQVPWMRRVSGRNVDQEQDPTCRINPTNMLFDFMLWWEQNMRTCQVFLTIDPEIIVVKMNPKIFAVCFET